jgi:Zn-dependent metalloprotease
MAKLFLKQVGLLGLGIVLFTSIALPQTNKHCTTTRFQLLDRPLPKDVNTDSSLTTSLEQQINVLQPAFTKLNLEHKRSSLTGTHYTYRQFYKEIPVYGTQLKISVDKQNHMRSQTYCLFDTEPWQFSEKQWSKLKKNDRSLVINYVKQHYNKFEALIHESIIYVPASDSSPLPAYRADFYDPEKATHQEVIIDLDGTLLYQRDLTRYYSPLPDTTDSLAQIKVYNPDPLTTAGTTYGGSYVDNNDQTNASLDAQLMKNQVTTTFKNDTFYLENEYVKEWDISSPDIPPTYSISDTFFFTRADTGFESVNAFYHITTYKKYIESLGWSDLPDFQLRIDAYGTTAENSSFSSSPIPNIKFGTGGVDDAEDADVIIHEYGHAIAHSAAPNTFDGHERKALEEGLGDYLAASYSRHLSDTMWDSVFTWDGWNEFWNGRLASSNQHYPEDMSNSSIHNDGQIWSSVLMEVWNSIGRDTTDQLVLESVFRWSSNMDMPEAAKLLLQADTLLYNSRHSDTLFHYLSKRGLLGDSIPPEDTTQPDPAKYIKITVTNSSAFAVRKGPLVIHLPDTAQQAALSIYNVQGRLVDRYKQNTGQSIYYHGYSLPIGMYILKINTNLHHHTTRIVRLR